MLTNVQREWDPVVLAFFFLLLKQDQYMFISSTLPSIQILAQLCFSVRNQFFWMWSSVAWYMVFSSSEARSIYVNFFSMATHSNCYSQVVNLCFWLRNFFFCMWSCVAWYIGCCFTSYIFRGINLPGNLDITRAVGVISPRAHRIAGAAFRREMIVQCFARLPAPCSA
jgi:hypothetical protein